MRGALKMGVAKAEPSEKEKENERAPKRSRRKERV